MHKSSFPQLLLFTLIAVITLQVFPLKGDWERVPVSVLKEFNAITFTDSRTGYLVGRGIYKTINGGLSWFEPVRFTGSEIEIWDISALSEEHIWFAAGESGLLFSTDGARSLIQRNGSLPVGEIRAVEFSSDNKGLICIKNNESGKTSILRTQDGGLSWADVTPAELENLKTVLDSLLEGFAFRWFQAGIYDGFLLSDLAKKYYKEKLHFTSPNEGWLKTAAGLFYTADAGTNWSLIKAGNILDFAILDSGKIIVSVEEEPNQRTIFISEDMGQTYNEIRQEGLPVSKLAFLDNDTGWGASGEHIYKTVDGGLSWELEYTVPYDSLIDYSRIEFTVPKQQFVYDLFVSPDSTGWAAGTGNTLFVLNPAGTLTTGDINGDRKIDIYDLLELIKGIKVQCDYYSTYFPHWSAGEIAFHKKYYFPIMQRSRFDLNHDGGFNIFDLLEMLKIMSRR